MIIVFFLSRVAENAPGKQAIRHSVYTCRCPFKRVKSVYTKKKKNI